MTIRPPIRSSFRALFALLLLLVALGAQANAPVVALEDLHPLPEHRRATRLITHVIANYHYRKVMLDDALSRVILERYIDALDPTRSYLLASDIAEFDKHATRIDDYLRSSSLDPLFDMFVRFRERLRERVEYAVAELDEPMDFTVDESIDFDREDVPWATSTAELDELWRKRVKNDILSLRLAGKDDEDINKTLRDRYTGLFRRTAQLTSDDVFQTLINAFTTAIDPHTAYFSPRTSENFKIRMSLSLEGIGAVLQNENEMTLVREVVTGGPAELSGKLHADDRIVGIGQDADGPVVDVVGWRLDDVVDLIRGPKGSTVRLEVLPKGTAVDGPTQVVSIVRDTIKLEEQAAKGSVHEVAGGLKVGVIDVPTFYMDFEARSAGDPDYRSTTRDVRAIIKDLVAQGVSGLILDLRSNGGGSLNEATELTGLFIDHGPVVQVRDSQGRVQIERDTDDGVAYAGPLMVLVDRNSASASEIVAGAIQDYHRGLIVGEPTFGKGTVQNLVDLNRFDQSMGGKLGQLKATIAQFFRVNGGSTQHRGVLPDIVLPTVISQEDYGERSLDNALPWAAIDPARYREVAFDAAALPVVRSEHEKRVLTDPAFRALLDTEKAIKEARDKTTVSLVESVRRAEHDKAREEQRERANAIRVAHGLDPLSEDDDTASEADDELAVAEDPPADEALDVVLDEAGLILRDWMTAVARDDQRLADGVAPDAPIELGKTPPSPPAAGAQLH
ncbi:MAG: carboxy terminal-processing peptidase [Gammaproteobacteria bacterium]|nr:carboxy terminal-processing peptidase [Gammaproteobacteria bacterium]